MACNCLCCGCQNCTEGQEGKCCCGGPTGECCQPGYFCCDGVCLEGGCCPEGCPSLEGCTLRVWIQYEDFQQEYYNGPAEYAPGSGCFIEFIAEDIPEESCGDVSATITIGYDENCCPVVTGTEGFPTPEDLSFEDQPCPDWQWELTCVGNPCQACPGGGPGLGTLNPDFCGGYDSCCTEEGCVPATYFLADVSDCVCYSDEGQTPGDPGVYATYADCCDENFCPDPPP